MSNFKVQVNQARNEVQIDLVDEKGNGIIVLTGKMGGCGYMSAAEQAPRIEALKKIVEATQGSIEVL